MGVVTSGASGWSASSCEVDEEPVPSQPAAAEEIEGTQAAGVDTGGDEATQVPGHAAGGTAMSASGRLIHANGGAAMETGGAEEEEEEAEEEAAADAGMVGGAMEAMEEVVGEANSEAAAEAAAEAATSTTAYAFTPEAALEQWEWQRVVSSGPSPPGRWAHSAVALAGSLHIYGGDSLDEEAGGDAGAQIPRSALPFRISDPSITSRRSLSHPAPSSFRPAPQPITLQRLPIRACFAPPSPPHPPRPPALQSNPRSPEGSLPFRSLL